VWIYDWVVPLLVAILATITLAPPFGEATAAAIDDSSGLTVEVTVVYDEAASAVIVRPFSAFEELPPTAMAAQEGGVWVAWVQLPTAQNWQIAFEGFTPNGGSDLSETTDLIGLGIDPVVIDSEILEPLPSTPLIPSGSWWLIIAVAFAAVAIGGIGYWAFSADEDDASEAHAGESDLTNGRE